MKITIGWQKKNDVDLMRYAKIKRLEKDDGRVWEIHAKIQDMFIEKKDFAKHYQNIRREDTIWTAFIGENYRKYNIMFDERFKYGSEDLNFNLPFSPDDSVEDIGLHLSEILANGIKKTRNLLDPVQLEMTAYNIKKSHRVFLFGKGDSRISLENFKNKMIKLNEYFIIGDEYQNNFYTVGNITSNDLVIFCTYSAMHHDYNSYLPVLKDHNVPIITVTSNIHSKLAVNSDIVLQLPDDESFDEKVCQFCLSNKYGFYF